MSNNKNGISKNISVVKSELSNWRDKMKSNAARFKYGGLVNKGSRAETGETNNNYFHLLTNFITETFRSLPRTLTYITILALLLASANALSQDWPVAEMTYKPTFPALGVYSAPEACRAIHNAGDPSVSLKDGETLRSAYDRLYSISGGSGGTILVAHSTKTVQCDKLTIPRGNTQPLTISGQLGPNGEMPKFYCRAEWKDGTIPKHQDPDRPRNGTFFLAGSKAGKPQQILIGQIHVDGYATHISAPS